MKRMPFELQRRGRPVIVQVEGEKPNEQEHEEKRESGGPLGMKMVRLQGVWWKTLKREKRNPCRPAQRVEITKNVKQRARNGKQKGGTESREEIIFS